MADRSNHYEVAFESLLRSLKVACLPIDETRRTFTSGETVKSLDFILTRPNGGAILIDVKGRSLRGAKPTMENWVRQEDVESLRRWRLQFGPGAVGVLAFVYQLKDESHRSAFRDVFEYADHIYGCVGIDVEDFAARMKPRSPQWDTYSLSQEDFRAAVKPITSWLDAT
jgi:hypothetical protein